MSNFKAKMHRIRFEAPASVRPSVRLFVHPSSLRLKTHGVENWRQFSTPCVFSLRWSLTVNLATLYWEHRHTPFSTYRPSVNTVPVTIVPM